MELADLIEVNDYGGRCLTRMIRGNNLTIEDWNVITRHFYLFCFFYYIYLIFFFLLKLIFLIFKKKNI